MVTAKMNLLPARGRNLMRQDGREVLAVPLHPKPHASFVGVHPTYKLSVV